MNLCKQVDRVDFVNTTYCVTGFNGYVGRHLVKYLVTRGAHPFLIGRLNTPLPDIPGTAKSKPWSEPAELAEQLSTLKNPLIINLAGYFVHAHSSGNLSDVVNGNFTYPTQIFEAMALSGVERIVNIGTSWEYTDDGTEVPFNLYAALKKSNATLLDWYAGQYPIRAMNLKLNDTYGGDDRRAKLMPLLKQHAQNREPLELRYSSQLLNLTYIDDVIAAILQAGQMTVNQQVSKVEEAFVFGAETRPICEIVDLIRNVTNIPINVRYKDTVTESSALRQIWHDAPRLRGWRPKTDLMTGLERYFKKEE